MGWTFVTLISVSPLLLALLRQLTMDNRRRARASARVASARIVGRDF